MRPWSLVAATLLVAGPLLFCLSATGHLAGLPYWHSPDPSYVYLVNSANLAMGFGPGHTDHPGTTAQLVGATALLVSGTGHSRTEIVDRVLSQPEAELWGLELGFLALIVAALWILGWVVYRRFEQRGVEDGALLAGVVAQMGVFGSAMVLYHAAIPKAEPVLLAASALWLAAWTHYCFTKSSKERRWTWIWLGLSLGFGLATKLNFLPALVATLVVAWVWLGWREGLRIAAATTATALVLTAPMWGRAPEFSSWVGRLVLGSGKYGSGERTVVAIDALVANLGRLAIGVGWIVLLLLLGVVAILGTRPWRGGWTVVHRWTAGIVLAVFVQFLIVGKHMAGHYMLPAVVMAGPLAVGIALLVRRGGGMLWTLAASALFLVGACAVAMPRLEARREGIAAKVERYSALRHVIRTTYPTCYFAEAYVVPSEDLAIHFGIGFGGNSRALFHEGLHRTRPKLMGYYHRWARRFVWADQSSDFATLRSDQPCVAVVGTRVPQLEDEPLVDDRCSSGDWWLYLSGARCDRIAGKEGFAAP